MEYIKHLLVCANHQVEKKIEEKINNWIVDNSWNKLKNFIEKYELGFYTLYSLLKAAREMFRKKGVKEHIKEIKAICETIIEKIKPEYITNNPRIINQYFMVLVNPTCDRDNENNQFLAEEMAPIICQLIERGVDINVKIHNKTALESAIYYPQKNEVLQKILEKYPVKTDQDWRETADAIKTALELANKYSNEMAANLLIQYIATNSPTKYGENKNHFYFLLNCLLNIIDKIIFRDVTFSKTTKLNHESIAETIWKLIEKIPPAYFNRENQYGNTYLIALMRAARDDGTGNPTIFTKAFTPIICELIDKGVHINERDKKDQNSVLDWAVYCGLDETVLERLFEKGVEIDAEHPKTRRTVLHSAIAWNRSTAANFLIKKGANIQAKDGGGRTPLHIAVQRGYHDIAKLLLEKGAKVDEEALSKKRIFIEQGKTETIDVAETALFMAILNKDVDMVKLLVENGAKVEYQISTTKDTALHCAVESGDFEICKILCEKNPNISTIANQYGAKPCEIAFAKDLTFYPFLLDQYHKAQALAVNNASHKQAPVPTNPKIQHTQTPGQKTNQTIGTGKSDNRQNFVGMIKALCMQLTPTFLLRAITWLAVYIRQLFNRVIQPKRLKSVWSHQKPKMSPAPRPH